MTQPKQTSTAAARLLPAPGRIAPVRPGDLAVVVGAGASGVAAARLLDRLGARVRLLDKNETGVGRAARDLIETRSMELVCGEHAPEHFAGASLAVTSPGVPIASLLPLLKRAGGSIPLLAETELALRFVQEAILAVTGTSGKTTTVSLAAAMLEAAGKRVFLGGNIGTPLSDYVLGDDKADVLVLEMSSFQLQGSPSLRPDVAVLLNLTENHLDYHKDFAEYRDAKFRIFARQTGENLALLPEDLLEEYARRGCAAPTRIIGRGGRFSDIRLAGLHNAANAEAAYLAVSVFGVSEAHAARAVANFAPLRHRLESAGRVRGVLYVNDSKATTVDALRAALSSFDAPVLLLAGGKFKGGDLASLRETLRERVKAVALFGASREFFEKAWTGIVPLSWDADLASAVKRLSGRAAPGDVVLLSPATSSYDLYANYGQRGDDFCSLVRGMAEETDAPAGEVSA